MLSFILKYFSYRFTDLSYGKRNALSSYVALPWIADISYGRSSFLHFNGVYY